MFCLAISADSSLVKIVFCFIADGRGFMVRKRGVTKKESSPPNWDYEITSVDIALVHYR